MTIVDILLIVVGCVLFLSNVVDILKGMGCGTDRTKSPFRRFLGVLIGLPVAVLGAALLVVFNGFQQGTITIPTPAPTICIQCYHPPILHGTPPPFPLPTSTPIP